VRKLTHNLQTHFPLSISEVTVTKLFYRNFIVAILLCTFALAANANEESAAPFNYNTTWRIVYFQGNNQFINQRSNDEYNPMQGFSFIYEILIKYVYSMQSVKQLSPDGSMSPLGIWTAIYLTNDIGYQKLFIGDHTLSDGYRWVLMEDNDYLKLSEILLKRKDKVENPFDGDIENALKSHLWKNNNGEKLDDYETHFHIQKQNISMSSQATLQRQFKNPTDFKDADNNSSKITSNHSSSSSQQTSSESTYRHAISRDNL
jgi:hypothetical protein